MTRRVAILAVLTVVLLLGFATPAFGWANGGDNGNGYGSHDWILDEAIRVSGASGSWVDRTAALAATDDPDSLGVPGIYHVFHEQGGARGAPYMAEYYYREAVRFYQAGDYATASKYLGVLSHYYSDILQPFHAAYDARNYDALHASYELSVDDYQHSAGNVRNWITVAPRRPIADIRARAVEAGYFSRSKYATLFTAWKNTRSVSDPTVLSVTKQVQSRAVNDLADVIATIPTGNGCSLCPANMSVTVSKPYPGPGEQVCVTASCTDAAGAPIEAAMVTFRFDFAGGSVTQVAFTSAEGVATCWQAVNGAPAMTQVPVTVTSTGADGSLSKSTGFTPTPVLGDDTSGVSLLISNMLPSQRSSVTVKALVRDQTGRPVAGLPVQFSWHHDSGTVYTTGVTDSQGIATSTRDIGSATIGYRVWVKARVESGGSVRLPAISFVPGDSGSAGSESAVYVEDTSADVTFDRFVPCKSSSFSSGTYIYGRWAGTSLDCRFEGTGITWAGPKQPGYGKADIYVDGQKVATADCYAPASTATLSTVIWRSEALSEGTHTLSIRLTGARNAASTGNTVVVDKLIVTGADLSLTDFRANESVGAFEGTWVACNNSAYSSGSYRYSRWPGAVVEYRFSGTRVAWIGPRALGYGNAAIYIDGVRVATASQYGPLGWRYRVWESSTLPRGEHTIQIRVLGTKQASSSGTVVVVDGFDITP